MGKVEGSWIDGVVADGRVLWSHLMPASSVASLPPHQLLPSDCTLRPDIAVRLARFCTRQSLFALQCRSCVCQALKAGNYAEANRLKDLIEGEKRAEKALRERRSK